MSSIELYSQSENQLSAGIPTFDATQEFEQYYMNSVQLLANIIDPNVLIAEWARATGKTEGVMTPRIIKVANDMPGELSFLVHKIPNPLTVLCPITAGLRSALSLH